MRTCNSMPRLPKLHKKVNPETEITHGIRRLLAGLGVFHWKNWGGPMGERGVADILGAWQGKLLAIEVKTPTGKLSEHQERFLARVVAAGGVAIVARSVDDVIDGLGVRDRFLPLGRG